MADKDSNKKKSKAEKAKKKSTSTADLPKENVASTDDVGVEDMPTVILTDEDLEQVERLRDVGAGYGISRGISQSH